MDEKLSKKHMVNLVDRQRLNMTGILDVFSFNEEVVELETVDGYLDIEGMDLHIVKMNLDSGEVIVEGRIIQLTYEDQAPSKKKGSMLSKFFK
ncbi:MAG: sporulation protein YabP [Cellulosilyticaceae bacterium]